MYISESLLVNPSLLDWRSWQDHITFLLDRQLANYVVQGICEGFHIGLDYQHHKTQKATRNMYSAEVHPSGVQEYTYFQGMQGRKVAGPL